MGIVLKPVVTEKMTSITDKLNRYGFIVKNDANKLEIKDAVEKLYSVTVTDVNTMRYAGKAKSRYTKTGLISGKTKAFKKAVVSLKDGDTIDFYSNI
ncbi:MAG: 50S ribosomal protein L23 [Bacteroidota bacterium]|nr:50S ribosomal protein L23 [Bacteroidota bacterium]